MFRFREITYAKNCAFACVHKEIDNTLFPGANYSFRESGLQITSRLLSSSFGSCSLTLASKIAANWNCSSHAKIRTNPSKIKKQAKIRHRSVMLSALQLLVTSLHIMSVHATLLPIRIHHFTSRDITSIYFALFYFTSCQGCRLRNPQGIHKAKS